MRMAAAGDSRDRGGARLHVGSLQAGRGHGLQPGQGATELGFPTGLSRGRCTGRRAERVIRPTRAKTRRLRVLVITVRSPRPIRAAAGQVMRIMDRQPGAVGGEAPRPVQPDAVLDVWRSRPRRGGDDRPPVPASPHRGR